MDPKLRKLLEETQDKMLTVCEREWDRYTDRYIVPQGTYTREQEMEKADRWAWRLYNEIGKVLAADDVESDQPKVAGTFGSGS